MKHRVLVADDDFDNRTIAKEVLERSGYEVIQATNGVEALELIMKEKPEVVLLDLSMPKMSGWEVARRVRESEGTRDLPIVAFTAHALVGDEQKALASGCSDYISKPAAPKSIVRKVEEWLARREKA